MFLFDSGTDAIFTSGSYGGPQAIFDTAGVTSATADVEDTWTEVGWERMAASDPDVIFFVDYPGQSHEEKVAVLKANPASRDLAAVREERFVNLPLRHVGLRTAQHRRGRVGPAGRRALRPRPRLGHRLDLDITTLTNLPGNDWAR